MKIKTSVKERQVSCVYDMGMKEEANKRMGKIEG